MFYSTDRTTFDDGEIARIVDTVSSCHLDHLHNLNEILCEVHVPIVPYIHPIFLTPKFVCLLHVQS